MGLNYGKTFQAVEEIQVGNNEVLAKLKLSESIKSTIDEFKLHPSLMDAALQTMGALSLPIPQLHDSTITQNDNKLSLPFALSELNIYQGFTEECYAYGIFILFTIFICFWINYYDFAAFSKRRRTGSHWRISPNVSHPKGTRSRTGSINVNFRFRVYDFKFDYCFGVIDKFENYLVRKIDLMSWSHSIMQNHAQVAELADALL